MSTIKEWLATHILLVGVLMIVPPSWMFTEPSAVPSQPTIDVEPVISEVQLDSRLQRVCSCESTGKPNNTPRQFNSDGTVLRGKVNPADIGACQINEDVWGSTAKKLNYDIYTLDGNILMANWIVQNDSRGIENWSWSKSCWGEK